MILGRVLAEILERGEGLGAFLHLVEDDERGRRIDALARDGLENRYQSGDVVALVEGGRHERIVVEADVGDVFELDPAELLEQPRLSHLARTVEDERFAAFRVLPFDEVIHEKAVHFSSKHKETPL